MNYGITTAVPADYGIHLTDEDVDDVYVFKSFSDAKKGIISSLQRQKDELNIAIKEMRALKLKDI